MEKAHRRRALAGLAGLLLAMAACCLVILGENGRGQAVSLEEGCSEQELAAAASALGFGDVEAYKKHMIRNAADKNPCSAVLPAKHQDKQSDPLNSLFDFMFGTSADRSNTSRDDMSHGEQKKATNSEASQTPKEITVYAEPVPSETEKKAAVPHTQVHSDEEGTMGSNVAEEKEEEKEKKELKEIDASGTLQAPSVESKEEKKEEKKEDRAAEHKFKQVESMEAEAAALGYALVPSAGQHGLTAEAKKLGFTLEPASAASPAQGSATRVDAAPASMGDDAVVEPEAAAKSGQTSGLKRMSVDSTLGARRQSLAEAPRVVGGQSERVGSVRSRGSSHGAHQRHRLLSSHWGSMLPNHQEKLNEEGVVEREVRKHLAAKALKADAMLRLEKKAAQEHAEKSALSAISRYDSVMSFDGHEGGKEEVVVKPGELAMSSVAEQMNAAEKADKTLKHYADIWTFHGHEGGQKPHVDVGGLERSKMKEMEGERVQAGAASEKQLNSYDLLSFHDEDVALKELEGKEGGRGGGGRGRGEPVHSELDKHQGQQQDTGNANAHKQGEGAVRTANTGGRVSVNEATRAVDNGSGGSSGPKERTRDSGPAAMREEAEARKIENQDSERVVNLERARSGGFSPPEGRSIQANSFFPPGRNLVPVEQRGGDLSVRSSNRSFRELGVANGVANKGVDTSRGDTSEAKHSQLADVRSAGLQWNGKGIPRFN